MGVHRAGHGGVPDRAVAVAEGAGGALRRGRRPAARRPRPAGHLLGFLPVYRSFSGIDGVMLLWCWSHIRRRFIRAGDAHRKELGAWAGAWTARIGVLYAAHRALAAAPDGTSEHARAAAAFGAALEDIDAHRRIQGRRWTCCTRPRRRCWPPWTANGTGWPATATSPPCRWTITPPSGPSAPRSWAARTTTAPARHGPRAWPAMPGRSWALPGSPGTTPRLPGRLPGRLRRRRRQAAAGQALAALLPWTITLPGEPGSRKDHPP